MSEKEYLHLLFLCGILCQGIFATLSDKDSRLSSDFLVRKRRVINHLPGGRNTPPIETVNYIVRIKENARSNCAGAILSDYTVITAASCVQQHLTNYVINSGASGDRGFNIHNVTSRVVYSGNPPYQIIDRIALITVDLPFVYTRKTGNIQLHVGGLPAGTLVTAFGWGYMRSMEPRTEARQKLRSITVPIMDHEVCQNNYRYNNFAITDKYICTYHAQQYTARNDEGAPLVFNNMLVGIHVWNGEYQGQRNPDIFINLQRPDYGEWVRNHILSL